MATEAQKQQAYEAARDYHTKEKAKSDRNPSPIMDTVTKYGRMYLSDPVWNYLSRGLRQSDLYNEERRARKDVLGYKRGGSVKTAEGGSVRGCGCAKRGVKKCKVC